MKPEDSNANIRYYEDYLKSLCSCVQSLTRLIEKENKFLMNELNVNFAKILEQKEELLLKLQGFDPATEKLSWKDAESNSSKQIVAKLNKAYSNLDDAIGANSILLKSNIGVSSKILELYKAKQLEHAVGQLGYNKDGEMVALKKLEKVMPSISLNNKI
jgi:hypothetical protein